MKDSKKDLKKQEVILKITKEEKEKILNDLIFKGGTTEIVSLLNGKLEVVFQTLNSKLRQEINDIPISEDSSLNTYYFKYNVETLKRGLIGYNKEHLNSLDFEEKCEFIDKIPEQILTILIEEYNKFVKKVKTVCTSDEVDESFLDETPTS